MTRAHTLTGRRFDYTGSLTEGIVVRTTKSSMSVKREIIEVIRSEISRRSPVLMGASRGPFVRDSVGETLRRDYGASPQTMSYVVPLLVEEGFCTVSARRPFMIRKS